MVSTCTYPKIEYLYIYFALDYQRTYLYKYVFYKRSIDYWFFMIDADTYVKRPLLCFNKQCNLELVRDEWVDSCLRSTTNVFKSVTFLF